MEHILILPQDLNDKLHAVVSKASVISCWNSIGVTSVNEMLLKIINDMNSKFPKLNITGFRFEDKNIIKSKVANLGKESVYAGYLEKDNAVIDGLFFYIPPTLDSANDILSRQVIPSLMGIYSGIHIISKDLHLNNRPVFIVNLNELGRMNQRSVKVNIISSILMGFNYLDVFENEFESIIINGLQNLGKSVEALDNLITDNGSQSNDWFELNKHSKSLKVLASKLSSSSNPTAEIYRFILKVLPAIYIGINEDYTIDASDLNTITNKIEALDMIKIHISDLAGR